MVLPRTASVLVAASATVLVRLVGLPRPLRADEAGFTLVARAWSPAPDSLYGPYFVDRPPSLLALFRYADALVGPLGVRLLGAIACGLLVLAAAWLARLLEAPPLPVAIAAAALAVTPAIDLVSVKGEVLALPLLVLALCLTLRATSPGWAFAAGLVAALPLGLKQNLASALVFLVVLLALRRPRLLVPALLGAAVPVLATVLWAWSAGVHLETLWYAVFGFRGDANAALGAGSPASRGRLLVLLGIALMSGMGLALTTFLFELPALWLRDRALTLAAFALAAFDLAALLSGGSFWPDYAFGLVPGTLVALALIRPRRRRLLVVFTAVSSLVWLVGWGVVNLSGHQELDEADTGTAVGAAAERGDSLVVFGGRADVQLAAGLPSPYPYLWSLPMRALDPSLNDLRALVAGPDAPTWIVEWWPFDLWSAHGGAALQAEVEQRYVEIGTGCDDKPIWLLRDVTRGVPRPDCHG